MEEYKKHLSEGPQTALEKRLIEEYLRDKGYSRFDISLLPIGKGKALMREACLDASLKLAEIDSRARFRKEIKAPK